MEQHYREGCSLKLEVRHPGDIPLTLTTEVTIDRIILPPTLSVVMVVVAKDQSGVEFKAILKLFDRRFADGLRRLYRFEPWSPETEASYVKFVTNMHAKKVFDELDEEENEADDSDDGDEDDDQEPDEASESQSDYEQGPAANEAVLQHYSRKIYSNEVRVYKMLEALQGQMIPKFLAAVHLLPDNGDIALQLRQYVDVGGILLQYIEGFDLFEIETRAPADKWQSICDEAVCVVDHTSAHDFINNDVRPGNFIVKGPRPDGSYQVFQIDFGQVYFREGAPWEKWRERKRLFDEEGAVGLVMQKLLKGGYTYKRSYKFHANPEEAANRSRIAT